MTAIATETWTEAASWEASGEEMEASTETVVHVLARKLTWELLACPCVKH